jgi:hypothetical protein
VLPRFCLKAYTCRCAGGQPLQYYVNMLEDEAKKRREAERIQRQLDEALSDTFPASDPVAIVTSHREEDWGEEPAEPPPPKGAGAR